MLSPNYTPQDHAGCIFCGKHTLHTFDQCDEVKSERSTMAATITTADGKPVEVGSTVFDYYSMKVGEIVTEPDVTGWFSVCHFDGGRELLNGERICSLKHAKRMGWMN